jgi:hypothetical protein
MNLAGGLARTYAERMAVNAMTDAELLAYFLEHTMPIPICGCRIWLGFINPDTGYARVTIRQRVRQLHRWVCEQTYGPLPRHIDAEHTCHVRCCIEPTHIQPATRSVNLGRMPADRAALKHRHNSGKTHCKRGHPLSGDNLVPHRWRSCRTCRNALKRQRDQRRKMEK